MTQGTPAQDAVTLHDTKLCAFELGCMERAHQRDLCLTHYKRARGPSPRFGLPPVTARRHAHSMLNGRTLPDGMPVGDCLICGKGAPAYLKHPNRPAGSYVCRYWYSVSLREWLASAVSYLHTHRDGGRRPDDVAMAG